MLTGIQSLISMKHTSFVQVVAYEARRLFRDCLTTTEHTNTFDSILTDVLRKHWNVSLDSSGTLFTTIGAVSAASGELLRHCSAVTALLLQAFLQGLCLGS